MNENSVFIDGSKMNDKANLAAFELIANDAREVIVEDYHRNSGSIIIVSKADSKQVKSMTTGDFATIIAMMIDGLEENIARNSSLSSKRKADLLITLATNLIITADKTGIDEDSSEFSSMLVVITKILERFNCRGNSQ
jgi:D-aminopeptidase